MDFPTALTVISVSLLLSAEYKESKLGRWTFKPLASTGFLLIARQSPQSTGALVTGLYFAWLGDVFLISDSTFKAGIFSFLLGHVCYALSFHQQPDLHYATATVCAIPLIMIAISVYAGLSAHLPDDMRIPVVAYILVITVMVVTAVATHDFLSITGAVLFFLSDLMVARDKFVRNQWINRAIGLPLYYAAQIMLARTLY